MAIESWIDNLAKIWEVSTNSGKGNVTSYRLFERDEFPEALDPQDFPVALSYPTSVSIEYSMGGPCIEYWNGQTEFHLFADVKKNNLPGILRYFARIRDAAAGNMKLSGTADLFLLRSTGGAASIQGPLTLQYGDEAPHHGLVVFWTVKSHVSGDFSVTDPSL